MQSVWFWFGFLQWKDVWLLECLCNDMVCNWHTLTTAHKKADCSGVLPGNRSFSRALKVLKGLPGSSSHAVLYLSFEPFPLVLLLCFFLSSLHPPLHLHHSVWHLKNSTSEGSSSSTSVTDIFCVYPTHSIDWSGFIIVTPIWEVHKVVLVKKTNKKTKDQHKVSALVTRHTEKTMQKFYFDTGCV